MKPGYCDAIVPEGLDGWCIGAVDDLTFGVLSELSCEVVLGGACSLEAGVFQKADGKLM